MSHLQRSLKNIIIVTALTDCPFRCRTFGAIFSQDSTSYASSSQTHQRNCREFEFAWKATLLVTPYIRVKRGCAGDKAHTPSTAWRAVHRERSCIRVNQVQPSRLIRRAIVFYPRASSPFVEYAPRLLTVLPSRQFLNFSGFKVIRSDLL